MKQCKQCNKEYNPKRATSKYCSSKCRKLAFRVSVPKVSVPSEKVNVPGILAVSVPGKVYGRQAVKCNKYDTRPEPLDPTDRPHPGGRGKYRRQDGTIYQFDSTGNVREEQPAIIDTTQTASLDHYQSNPDQYAKRTNAATLNWGEPMSSPELAKAKLTANRVAIPGDWDYTKPTPKPEPTKKPKPSATQGTQPTGQPNTNTAKLTSAELGRAIGSYSGLDWVASAEYAELMLRLSTWSLAKLKERGHVVPQWRHEQR
jgi:hypothetical protein